MDWLLIFVAIACIALLYATAAAGPRHVPSDGRATAHDDTRVGPRDDALLGPSTHFTGTTDAFGINKPGHPLDGLSGAQPVPNRLVGGAEDRPYLPRGHLEKHFDMADRVGHRTPLGEQTGVIRGLAADQSRSIQTGRKNKTVADAVNAEARPTRAPLADARAMPYIPQPNSYVTNHGKEAAGLTTRGPISMPDWEYRPRTNTDNAERTENKSGIKVHDWTRYPGLANSDAPTTLL